MTHEQLSGPLKLIIDAAKLIGTEIQSAPSALTGDKFNTELLAAIERGPSTGRSDRDLPKAVHAIILDGTPVLLGELEAQVQRRVFHDALRRHRNQASIARSWLGAQAPNLQLFLTGPIGSARDAVWRQFAAEAEVDDRVCRKLVWLPPQSPTVQDAGIFLSRTFLARPWEDRHGSESSRLDRLSDIDLPLGWDIVIDDDSLEADSLISTLIELDGGHTT